MSGGFCKHHFGSGTSVVLVFFFNFFSGNHQAHEQSGGEQMYPLRVSNRETCHVNTKNSPPSLEVEPASQFGECIEKHADESDAFVPIGSSDGF